MALIQYKGRKHDRLLNEWNQSASYAINLIVFISADNKLEFKCSGVLINKDYVITAAHCVHEGNLLKSNKTMYVICSIVIHVAGKMKKKILHK